MEVSWISTEWRFSNLCFSRVTIALHDKNLIILRGVELARVAVKVVKSKIKTYCDNINGI